MSVRFPKLCLSVGFRCSLCIFHTDQEIYKFGEADIWRTVIPLKFSFSVIFLKFLLEQLFVEFLNEGHGLNFFNYNLLLSFYPTPLKKFKVKSFFLVICFSLSCIYSVCN